MKGLPKPVASLNGLPCSGHGLCIPGAVHEVTGCGTPPKPKGIVIKNKTCWWPPLPLIPIFPITPDRLTVLVNGIPIMLHGDTFTPHPSSCTNIVVHMCPCGNSVCPRPTPYPCSVLTIEDAGGVGHPRILNATTLTVLGLKRFIARVADPLGVGLPGKSYVCSSVVTYGSPNVISG